MLQYIAIFLVGGLTSLSVTFAEVCGYHCLSGLAIVFPTMTVVSYLFLGHITDGVTVSRHALFVVLTTLVAWIPYMLALWYFAPKIGTPKAMGIGLSLFAILTLIFMSFFNHQ